MCFWAEENKETPTFCLHLPVASSPWQFFQSLQPDCSTRCPLASYPFRPEDLGEAFLEKAYQGEKPEPRYLPELADLVKNHVKVRDIAKCLQGTMVSSSKGLSETCQMQPAVPQPAVQAQQEPPAQETQPGSAEFMSQMMSWMKSSQEAFQKITAAKTTEMESNKEPILHYIALPCKGEHPVLRNQLQCKHLCRKATSWLWQKRVWKTLNKKLSTTWKTRKLRKAQQKRWRSQLLQSLAQKEWKGQQQLPPPKQASQALHLQQHHLVQKWS